MTTTSPVSETAPALPVETLFPHIVNGVLAPGSFYTTEFIIFSPRSEQSPSGNLRFIKHDDGTPLRLTLQ
jgi:hypothetical protein